MTDTAQQFIKRIKLLNSTTSKFDIIYTAINADQETPILSTPQLQAIYAHILSIPNLLSALTDLTPNSSYRLLKITKSLPRTCVILKYPDEHIELIVMPNRKLSTGEKFEPQIIDGSLKRCKIAYRIDDPSDTNIKRARLRVELTQPLIRSQEEILTSLQREARISQKLSSSPFICPIYLSSTYKHNGSQAIYGFSEFGKRNLYDLIEAIKANKIYLPGQPLPDILVSIIGDILKGMVHIHAHKIVHGDISLGNIILDENNRAKFIDFGAAVDSTNADVTPITEGTTSTASPEVLLRHNKEWKDAYGAQVVRVYCRQFSYNTIERKTFFYSPFDDMWSIGIIIIALITLDHNPRDYDYIKFILTKNPLLQALLQTTRSDRIDAVRALKLWNDNPILIAVSHDDFSLQKNINRYMKSIIICFKNNSSVAITLLKQCAEDSKYIKDPSALISFDYKKPELYSRAAEILEKIQNQHRSTLNTSIVQILTSITIKDSNTATMRLRARLQSSLSRNINQELDALFHIDQHQLITNLTLSLSTLLNNKRRYLTFFGQLSRYNVTDLEINKVVLSTINKIKTTGTQISSSLNLESSFADEEILATEPNAIVNDADARLKLTVA